jgi:protein-export membrane protein SecD
VVHGKTGGEMNLKKIFKEWRILLVLILVAGSILLILPTSQKGVVVKSINSDSPLIGKVSIGESITWANEKDINTPEDLYSFEDSNYTGIFRFIHSGTLELVYVEDGYLGITVAKTPATKVQFGLDLVGGTRVILEPVGNVTDAILQQTIATLETRVNTFGLKEANFRAVSDISGTSYIEIEMAGGSIEEINNLLAKQGQFEGKIPRVVTFSNNTGEITLNQSHTINLVGDDISVDGLILKANETSSMEGVDYQVLNLTDKNVTLMYTIFTGADIQSVCLQDQPGICSSRIIQQTGGWEFNFQVFVTQESAERFAKVTNTMKVVTEPGTTSSYLENRIYLYLDNNLITDLSISADLRGKALTSPAITGFRTTRSEALNEQLTLKSILQSGSLPVSLNTIRIDQISPVLGSEFLRDALIAVIIAEAAAAGVIYFRYRRWKILLPNVLWSLFELILTLGVATVINWTIDLASIAGLIAAIGSGSNDQIIMIDEILIGGAESKVYSLKQRIKRSFSIIFGAAATVITGVAPMFFVGIGAMRGFAVTTTIGIFIGIVITRPAFSRVAEIILGKEAA